MHTRSRTRRCCDRSCTGGSQVRGPEAKFYAMTKAGVETLGEETAQWRQRMGLVDRLLNEEFQV
jgi:DNA-binding PadR family transcriptional regulator